MVVGSLAPVVPVGAEMVVVDAVVVVASGSAEMTLSTPATHADASSPNETKVMAILRIGASVEGDSRCPVYVASLSVL